MISKCFSVSAFFFFLVCFLKHRDSWWGQVSQHFLGCLTSLHTLLQSGSKSPTAWLLHPDIWCHYFSSLIIGFDRIILQSRISIWQCPFLMTLYLSLNFMTFFSDHAARKYLLFIPYLSLLCACMLSCFSCIQHFVTLSCSLPGSSDHGILQARIWEWVAMLFSRGTLPNPGIKPMSLVSPALTGGFFTDSASWEAHWFSVRGQFHYPGDTSPYLEIALTIRIWSGEYCFWYLVYRRQATDAVQHPTVHWKVSPIKNYLIPNFSSAKVETPCSVAQNPHAVLNKVNVRTL